MSDADLGCGVTVTIADTGAVTARLTGELDMASEQYFLEALRLILQNRPSALCVDLSGVTFIDSSGIRVLLQSRILATSIGAEFRCANPTDQARRVFDIVQVGEFLGVAPD
jgi:anti-sigma B factor antagonist